MRTVPLSSLRAGHHPDAPAGVVNVRRAGREAGLDALAASIGSLGVLQPLVVVPVGDVYFVADGNRRLAALEALLAAGKLQADATVPVIERDAETAREAGLAANITQSPMCEADQVAAFAEMRQAGLKEKDIALRFGQPVPHVKRLLALGGVSPAVLDAWRAGKLRIDDVKHFTLAGHADQDRVLAKVLKDGSTWAIRRELGLDADVGHLLSYVGAKAYQAGGGQVVKDLFGDRDAVSDPALLKRLANERLEAECVRRRAEGWAWVETAESLPTEARWQWQKLKEETRPLPPADQTRWDELDAYLNSEDDEDATDEEIAAAHAEVEVLDKARRVPLGADARGRTGCILSLGRDGKVEVRDYVIRPEDAPAKKEAAAVEAAKPEPEEKGLSAALIDRLAEQATRAVQAALPSSPKAGLAILLAGALCENRGAGPMHVSLGGLDGASASIKQSQAFEVVLAGLLDRSVEDLLEVAAAVAARGVGLQHYDRVAPAARPSAMALMGAIDPDALTTALQDAFDGEAFFKAVPKDAILGIVGEVLGEAEARRVKDKKKAELVEFAVASVIPTGWLPAEIRHPGYAGPGAVIEAERLAAAA